MCPKKNDFTNISREISWNCIPTCPVNVFQNLIHRSAVPPPLANNPGWWGDQAMALTAAKCSVKVWTGCKLLEFQTKSLLSLPPEAKYWLSGDHFKPQTGKKLHTYTYIRKITPYIGNFSIRKLRYFQKIRQIIFLLFGELSLNFVLSWT